MAAFQIIAAVGSARSLYIEAIDLASEGNFDEARAKIKEGEEAFNGGHQAHGELLTKDDSTFPFENGQLEYSLKKDFEYSGEKQALVMYWPVEEILQKGIYNAEFFIDGNLIGTFPFQLK